MTVQYPCRHGENPPNQFVYVFWDFSAKWAGLRRSMETGAIGTVQRGGTEMEGNTEAEMLEDMAKRFCPNCGAAVTLNGKGRPRIFCSEPCRYAWKNRNPHPENWKSTRTAICPECGKPFLASREYGRVRKYCSHACANRGRAKRKEREGNEG